MARKARTRARTDGIADGVGGASSTGWTTAPDRTLRLVRSLLVLPTYQEAANVVEVLRRVRAAAPGTDVLVVDDGSPDGTADLAQAAGRELGGMDVLRRTAKAGLGKAYRAGFAVGLERGYEVLVEMDADLSHDPAA